MSFILGAIVLLVAAAVVGAVAFARSSKKDFDDANVIVEGVDTGAPASWAGAHSPEAKLHRQLRDAVRALQANAALNGYLEPQRLQLEQVAVAIDRRLVAAAALPASGRDEAIEAVASEVAGFEAAVVEAASGSSMTEQDVIGDTTAAINERLTAVAEAQAEIDAVDATPSLAEHEQMLTSPPVAPSPPTPAPRGDAAAPPATPAAPPGEAPRERIDEGDEGSVGDL